MKAIDLFAGWGGFTIGAEMAGAQVVWAANHSPLAVRAHAMNHPRTIHVCQDLHQADFTRVPDYDLLLAAPCCQGHTPASQPNRRPYHDAQRATAWAIVTCAEVTRPRAIIVENVPNFERWELYPEWRRCLEKLGYHLTGLVGRASYLGVPQRRTRLFVVATRNARRIQLREQAHETPFGPCIEWDAGEWRPWRKASLAVQERIRSAQRNHGPRALSQHVSGHPGVPLHEPVRTITTKDQWCVVDGELYRPFTIRENARAMDFPDTYVCPPEATRRECITGFGNALPPRMARAVVTATLEAA